jgi:Tfp pilus assembly protein PilF
MSQVTPRNIVMHARTPVLILATLLLLAGCGSPEKRAADYLVKAQEFYDAGDYVKARLEAQNAAQVEPKNAQARFLLAEIAEQQKEYQQMFGHLTWRWTKIRATWKR